MLKREQYMDASDLTYNLNMLEADGKELIIVTPDGKKYRAHNVIKLHRAVCNGRLDGEWNTIRTCDNLEDHNAHKVGKDEIFVSLIAEENQSRMWTHKEDPAYTGNPEVDRKLFVEKAKEFGPKS